ncbi:MAG: helix-turn-helix domain-containing protein [Gallionella sp.]|nr:helix-turn-helix domain-containing protein [Gallionella sp.]
MPKLDNELKNCRKQLRLTLPEMATKLNVSTTTVVNYETGKRLPDVDFLIDLAEVSGMSLIYWLGLRAEASKSAGAAKAKALLDAVNSAYGSATLPAEQPFVSLQLYDIRDAANVISAPGKGGGADDMLQFSTAWIKRKLHAAPDDLFQIIVDDESMVPTLRPGDTILLDKRATQPSREGVYIMVMNGVPLIKRLQILPGGIVKVVSDNSAYETFTIPLTEINGKDFTILGRVIWVVWAGRRI